MFDVCFIFIIAYFDKLVSKIKNKKKIKKTECIFAILDCRQPISVCEIVHVCMVAELSYMWRLWFPHSGQWSELSLALELFGL